MSRIEKLKAEAVALRTKEKALGRVLKHSDALEQVARNHGYTSWRACSAVLASASPADASPKPEKARPDTAELKRYQSSEWDFALDIPKRWNSFPPVSTNSPYEVIRFASNEEGRHLLIVFRQPRNPKQSVKEHSDQVQQILARSGFGNFAAAETNLQSGTATVLSFDKPEADGTWSCREYFVAEGGLIFVLGFGTTRQAEMSELYDRMARSFAILPK